MPSAGVGCDSCDGGDEGCLRYAGDLVGFEQILLVEA